jgi:MFS family permease
VGFGLTGVVRTIPGYALTITVWTLGEIVMAGIAPAATADAAPPHLRGAYQGIFSAGMGAAALLAPSLGSLVMGRFGSAALWMACAATCFVSAAGQLALGFRHKPALLGSTAR